MISKLERPLIFFDLETTGVNTSTDRIVQFAAIAMDTHKGQLIALNEMNLLIHPGMSIPPAASKIHDIFDTDVETAPVFKEVAESIIKFMSQGDWAGYNITGFDVPLLLAEFARCGKTITVPALVDSFRIFKEDIPHTLTGAHKHYCGGATFEGAHNALIDIRATARVFHNQMKLDFLPDTVEGIYEHYRVPGQLDLAGKLVVKNGEVVLSFGKNKGVPVMEVDQNYFKWCRKNNVLANDAWGIIRDCYRKKDI